MAKRFARYRRVGAELNDDQKAKQDKIRPARSSRTGAGGGAFGGGRGGGSAEGERSEEENENANPFKQEPYAEAIAALSKRLAGTPE
jgi:hypothetical protein